MPRALGMLFCLALACAAQPTPAPALQRHVQEGQRALAEGRYADAEASFERVKELAPGPEIYAQLGVVYFQQGKFAQAVPVLRQALKLKPGLPNVDSLLAMSLSELGRFEEALPGLEKTFRRTPDSAMKRMSGLQLTRAYTGLKRDDKAVEVALELKRLYPNDPEILYHSGRLLGNLAYLTMKRLGDVAPESVWKRQAAGELFESQENYDSAIAEYRHVVAMAPRRAGIHFRLGRALLARSRQAGGSSGDSEEALQAFLTELEVDPTNANAAYEAGEIYRKSARFDHARKSFELGLKHYPDFVEAHIGLGRTLVALERSDQAAIHLRKAIALNPKSDVAFYALAQACRALGDSAGQQKALEQFQQLREQAARQDLSDPQREVTKQEMDPAVRQ